MTEKKMFLVQLLSHVLQAHPFVKGHARKTITSTTK